MKYLGIHKLLWFLLVLIYTMIDLLLVIISDIFYVIWNFKIPKNQWSNYHTYTEFNFLTRKNEAIYVDNNIIETIKRRYNFFKLYQRMNK